MAEIIESVNHLICEGKADEVFFSRLLVSMHKNVQVACPKKETDGAQGISAMHRRLQGLLPYFDKIERMVLAIDSDDDPDKAFEEGCKQFRKATRYPVPEKASEFAEVDGCPRTAILLVPSADKKGSLDTLLLKSFENKYRRKILSCVKKFCKCIESAKRGETREAKLRLRALIAASQEKNPGISLSFLLEEKNCPINLSHPSFDSIKTELQKLFP
jgi:hypothetical protein